MVTKTSCSGFRFADEVYYLSGASTGSMMDMLIINWCTREVVVRKSFQ